MESVRSRAKVLSRHGSDALVILSGLESIRRVQNPRRTKRAFFTEMSGPAPFFTVCGSNGVVERIRRRTKANSASGTIILGMLES